MNLKKKKKWIQLRAKNIYIYPFCELLIRKSFLNSFPPSLVIFIVLIFGMISVFKTVYLDKLKLNYACIRGYAKTPLEIISLSQIF